MPDEAQEAMRRARNLREALYDIFSAVLNKQTAPQLAMDRLNTNLHDAALHSWLVQPKVADRENTAGRRTFGVAPRADDVFAQRNASADCARRRGPADLKRSGAGAHLRFAHLPVVLP